MNCITQRHHPKHDEVLLMEDCELARSSDTSYWVRYPFNKPKATPRPTSPPSSRPTNPPTRSPTDEPSSNPSTPPSPAPTRSSSDQPSLRPSKLAINETFTGGYPSIGSSSTTKTLSSPTQVRNNCPVDLELLAVVGSVSYAEEAPIVIMEQATSFVKFKVQNVWKDLAISKIYTQISGLPYGDVQCYENDVIAISHETESHIFTAHCMKSAPVTIANVWISDPALDWIEDDAKVPKCCYPETNLPSVQYTFRIECTSKCPPVN